MLPEITLPVPVPGVAVRPPIVLFAPVMEIPATIVTLPAAVPPALVPMYELWTRLPVLSIEIPSWLKLLITSARIVLPSEPAARSSPVALVPRSCRRSQ